jgi:hypothetical protein
MTTIAFLPQLAAGRWWYHVKIESVVFLVLGVATLIVGFVGLVIKLIELGRK